jgi:hypothetical protein
MAYWVSRWKATVLLAERRVRSNRKQFYALRVTATVSAVVVPALVGLNLAGTGGIVVRWLTFALSLLAALCLAVLALFRFGDRWFLYRNLQDQLLTAGWTLVTSVDDDSDDAWHSFRQSTEAVIATYNTSYDSELIVASQSDGTGKKSS